MEPTTSSRYAEVEVLFREYSDKILTFIKTRVNNPEDAENIAQDVWLRIIESEAPVCVETARSYIFKIASNLVYDYLRNLYTRMGAREEIKKMQTSIYDITPDEELCVKQIEAFEAQRIECLPPQRRIIYIMSRYEDKSVADIAENLSLSFRTVENHLRMGRRDVRNFISAIA